VSFMKRVPVLLCLAASLAAAAEWTGYVADSKCARNPEKAATDAHAGCAVSCAKSGAALVFIVDGKVFKFANQEKVQDYAGKKVTISGKLHVDEIVIEQVR
jgi:hypothetical protein